MSQPVVVLTVLFIDTEQVSKLFCCKQFSVFVAFLQYRQLICLNVSPKKATNPIFAILSASRIFFSFLQGVFSLYNLRLIAQHTS